MVDSWHTMKGGGSFTFGSSGGVKSKKSTKKYRFLFYVRNKDGSMKVISPQKFKRLAKQFVDNGGTIGELGSDGSSSICCGDQQKQQQNGGDSYAANEGNITPSQFANIYSGKTEDEIMIGNSSFLGYNYPNDMANRNTRFVMLGNGKEVDMIHFMVVGRAGHILGFLNEIQQGLRFKSSAFNPQDLYSNVLGVNFFRAYGSRINQNPTQISNYINEYFNSSGVLNPPPFQPQFPKGQKY